MHFSHAPDHSVEFFPNDPEVDIFSVFQNALCCPEFSEAILESEALEILIDNLPDDFAFLTACRCRHRTDSLDLVGK